MKLPCSNLNAQYEFRKVDLVFEGNTYSDVFCQKNNKTVSETLKQKRYAKLKDETQIKYPTSADMPLGEFLLSLKSAGDPFYVRFLNKYGDLTYSIFRISDSEYLDSKGVYAYLCGGELKYIGRCKDSMKKRVNQGYGKIHPKNCFIDGQATNCHLNWRITAESSEVTLWLYELDLDAEIESVERELIGACNPPWNIKRG